MIENEEIIALIERNPRISRTTPIADINMLDEYYFEITGNKIRDKGCSSCVNAALNVVRGDYGYPTTNREIKRKHSNKRIDTCKKCVYSKGSSILLTCGTPIIGEDVPEGRLCGCLVHIKAKFKSEDCPLNFWDKGL